MRALLAMVVAATSVTAAAGAQPAGELIERTLAIVAGQPITLIDVRAALALGLLTDVPQDDRIQGATARLIERALVLREVQRYAAPDPPESAVDARAAVITSRFASPEALGSALLAAAFTEAQLRAWARDDLRIAAYLDQRFAAAGTPERRAELVRDWIADIRRRTPVVELKP